MLWMTPSRNIMPAFVLAFGCSVFLTSYSHAQTAAQLPLGTRENYVAYTDNSVSDEFNAGVLDTTKWGRRNTKSTVSEHYNDPTLVVMEQETQGGESVQYVSIKGTGDNPDQSSSNPIRTAGIVSRATGFYGFYSLRFRFRGFDTPEVAQNGTIWHPAVWGARNDSIDGVNRSNAPADAWTEIDFVEWENGPNGWSSDAPARFRDSDNVVRKVITSGPDAEKASMHKGPIQEYSSDWQTVGLEYSPDHLKLWKWDSDQWSHFGERVVDFVPDDPVTPENSFTLNTIADSARSPQFWILGSVVGDWIVDRIVNGTNNHEIHDMAFDVDFFRYYRHVTAEDMDWAWENELPSGGGSPLMAGDFNRDGEIDSSDYHLWKQTYGATTALGGSAADGNGDAVINAVDYAVWREQLDDGPPIQLAREGASAPEPSAAVAFLVALNIAVLAHRFRMPGILK